MKLKSILQTNRRPNVSVAAITVSSIAFVSLCVRFAYVFFIGDSDIEGDFFGFAWLSIFLYDLGAEIAMVGLGLIIWISTFFHASDETKFLFKTVGAGAMAVGFFFIGWLFTSSLYFSKLLEVFMAIGIALLATYVSTRILNYLSREISNIRKLKIEWLDFLVEIRNRHYRSILKRLMRADLYDEVEKEQLKKEVDNFEERLRDEAEKIIE